LSQTRAHSLAESLTNVGIGYGVSLVSQVVIFPMVGVHITFSTNVKLSVWFTAISIVRGYLLRRWFTRRTETV